MCSPLLVTGQRCHYQSNYFIKIIYKICFLTLNLSPTAPPPASPLQIPPPIPPPEILLTVFAPSVLKIFVQRPTSGRSRLVRPSPAPAYWEGCVVSYKQNQEMMHQHNHSTLLGSKRRAVYYPPTGTGRDTYIMTDNGGTNTVYTCQGVPQLGNFMKFGPHNRTYKPSSYTRFQKYVSDGTGRDQYVVSHHGGQYAEDDENGLLLRKFRDTMRDGGWSKNTTAREGWRVTKVANRERAVSEYQRTQNEKLSVPKRVAEKYEDKLRQTRQGFAEQ